MWRNTLGNMKVLIACEFSGTVRDEFLKYGHDAVSCDLLPSLSDKGRHIQGDVLDVINGENWDLMIAHPPCTYLTTAGNRHFKDNPEREREREREHSSLQCVFTMRTFRKSVWRTRKGISIPTFANRIRPFIHGNLEIA